MLFIDDEVMTGWGRTGRLWGIDHWSVTPDIIASAKGMTAGYTPLSAIIARDEIWSVLEKEAFPLQSRAHPQRQRRLLAPLPRWSSTTF